MRVKATQLGYHGNKRRKAGEVFDLTPYKTKDPKSGKIITVPAEKQFSESWMVKVDKKSKVTIPEGDEIEDDEVTGEPQGSESGAGSPAPQDDDVI